MFNRVDPGADPTWGWKSDSWQARIRTADSVAHPTTWFYTPEQTAIMQIEYGQSVTEPFGGAAMLLAGGEGDAGLRLLTADPKSAPRDYTPAPGDVAVAYRAGSDGKGFVQELRLPWKLLFQEVASTCTRRIHPWPIAARSK